MFLRNDERGLSLVELLVAIAIGSVVMTFMVQMFGTQNKLLAGENKVVTMHGNARNAMMLISKRVRHAGYDPQETGADVFGITDSSFSTAGTVSVATDTQFFATADMDEDGSISGADEYFGLRLTGTDLEIARVADAAGTISGWSVVARKITALQFLYLYEDGNSSDAVGLPDNNVPTRAFAKVRGVMVILTAETESAHNLTKVPSSETVHTKIKLRNNLGA